jgi:hypothetical protein
MGHKMPKDMYQSKKLLEGLSMRRLMFVRTTVCFFGRNMVESRNA